MDELDNIIRKNDVVKYSDTYLSYMSAKVDDEKLERLAKLRGTVWEVRDTKFGVRMTVIWDGQDSTQDEIPQNLELVERALFGEEHNS